MAEESLLSTVARSIITTRDEWDTFEYICLQDNKPREAVDSSYNVGKRILTEASRSTTELRFLTVHKSEPHKIGISVFDSESLHLSGAHQESITLSAPASAVRNQLEPNELSLIARERAEKIIRKNPLRVLEILKPLEQTAEAMKEDVIMARVGVRPRGYGIDNDCFDAVVQLGYVDYKSSSQGFSLTESGRNIYRQLSKLTEDPFDREDLATLTKGKIGANALAVLLYLKNNASHDETGVSIRTVFDELSELTPQASGNVVSRLKQFGLVTLTGQLPGVRRIALTERGKKAIELLHGAIGNPVEAIG